MSHIRSPTSCRSKWSGDSGPFDLRGTGDGNSSGLAWATILWLGGIVEELQETHHPMIASLHMYDWPEMREATDRGGEGFPGICGVSR